MKTLTQVLAEHRGGFVMREAEEALRDLIEAVQASGKKGSLTLRLDLSAHGRNNRELHLVVTHAVKRPHNPDLVEPSIWFGVRGGLQREDPEQRELFGPKGVQSERADGRSPAEQPQAAAG